MNKGQSLVEVIFALGVSALVLIAVVSLSSRSVKNSSFAADKASATKYAQEALEWMREQRDTSWLNFINKDGTGAGTTTWCLSSLSWPGSSGICPSSSVISGTIYRRELVMEYLNAENMNAAVFVKWEDSSGNHQVTAATTYTNWRK